MTQNIFQYDNVSNTMELNVPEILLVREFAELMKNERNICKEDPTGKFGLRAFREFTYIWLALDWKSFYADYSEQERHEEALKDACMTEEEFNNPEFRAACRKYRALQESNRSVQLLKSAQSTIDKLIDYFNNVDPEERDIQTGKPMYKVKDIMAELTTISKVHDQLKELESIVKKEFAEQSSIRAGAIEGFMPSF